MNDELKNKLLAAKVSPAAIAILDDQELTTEDQLKGKSSSDFRALGIKAGSADILAGLFAAVEAEDGKPKVADVGGPKGPAIAKGLNLADPSMLMMLLAGGAGKGSGAGVFSLVPLKQLLEWYDVNEPDNLAADILRGKYANEGVIAYVPGTTTVDLEPTYKYLDARRRGKTQPREFILGSTGRQLRLWPAGVVPMDIIWVDPFNPESTLGYDFTSESYNDSAFVRDGNILELRVLQFIELARRQEKFNPTSPSDRRFVLEMAKKGFDALAAQWGDVATMYEEMEIANTLPSMKNILGAPTGIGAMSSAKKTGGAAGADGRFRLPDIER